MSSLVRWLKRQADHNAVSYSRFGLPGDETDDRPPPTEIHIAKFDELDKQFMLFGFHSQRLALLSAGFGMSMGLFFFLIFFFEFDWYHHAKGFDIAAFMMLMFFVAGCILIHYQVVAGIKKGSPRLLIPFIVVYIFLFTSCFTSTLYVLAQLITGAHDPRFTASFETTRSAQAVTLFFQCIVFTCQGVMLESVARCRTYLARRQIHEAELQIANLSKSRNPNLNIVMGERPNGPTVAIAAETIGQPPTYDEARQQPPNAQRTLFTTVSEN
ncbi:unnamed protein product, partial [Mesorhabditis spiculigera]